MRRNWQEINRDDDDKGFKSRVGLCRTCKTLGLMLEHAVLQQRI